jgi:hypothetical protein
MTFILLMAIAAGSVYILNDNGKFRPIYHDKPNLKLFTPEGYIVTRQALFNHWFEIGVRA